MPFPWIPADRPPDVVLISMDTVRADALSCAGVPPGPYRTDPTTTPNIDAIAARGVRFERFFAHAPSTLSSHASMMTGLDPHGHAIPRNGFPLPPHHETLAERLREAGYDTLAVVGAAVLDSSMGLDQGFRWYDDTQPGERFESSARDVARRTLDAVDRREDPPAPLFLFVHFYDAHAPYAPPVAFDRFSAPGPRAEGPAFRELVQRMRRGEASAAEIERVAGSYLGEVAYVDAMTGVVVEGLRQRGLLSQTRPGLLIITADHGETLGDDPAYAWSHGSNVAYEVMNVPLVVEGAGLQLARGATVSTPVAMSGLASTVLSWVGLPSTLGDGAPFPELALAGTPSNRLATPIWFEATRPRAEEATFGWNNRRLHRGVWFGEHGGWFAPFLDQPFTAYAASQPMDEAWASWLASRVAGWDARAPGHVTASETLGEALQALGYVD